MDVLAARRRAGRAAAEARALAREGVLRQFRRRGGRGFDQVRAARDRARGDRALRALVPRPDLWRAVGGRRAGSTATASGRRCPISTKSRSTTSPRWSGRCARRDVAAFLVEPIQGKVVRPPSPGYLQRGAGALPQVRDADDRRRDPVRARAHRTVLRASSISASSPTWCCSPRASRGGHVPVGVVLMRRDVFAKVFDRMDKAVVHGSTFAKNDLAMAAGLATLDVIEAREADRERGGQGRAAADVPARPGGSATTSCARRAAWA